MTRPSPVNGLGSDSWPRRIVLKKLPRFQPSFACHEARACLGAILRSGRHANAVGEFERRFADYIGAAHAVMTPSARLSLAWILEALGLSEGDEVAVPAFTYHSIPATIIAGGQRPLFVDVGQATYTLDPDQLDLVAGPKTKAVIPTHLYGKPCDMDAVTAAAHAHGLAVIEDCAQSVGSEFGGRKCGSFGDAAYYTFGATKNLTTLVGGMVTTSRDDIANHVRQRVAELPTMGGFLLAKACAVASCMAVATRRWPFSFTLWPAIRVFSLLDIDPVHDAFLERPSLRPSAGEKRHGFAPHPAQAEVGLVQIGRCDELNDARVRTAMALRSALAETPQITVPEVAEGEKHIFVTFSIQAPLRDELAAFLRSRGIDTAKGYMDACSALPVFAEFRTPCPTAEDIKQSILHLPLYPSMTDRDIAHVARSVADFYEEART